MSSEFAALLSPHFRMQDLERSSATILGLWPDLTIAYVNSAWEAFADSNGGQPDIGRRWGVGARYLDAIPTVLRPFYSRLLQGAPGIGTSMHPASHVYECSSADVYRRFSMQVYALPERSGVVIVNSLVAESPHDSATRVDHGGSQNLYVNNEGGIVQCAHCRLVRQFNDPSQWDWVPGWIAASPAGTSHGLCPLCLEYYYPQLAVCSVVVPL